MFLIIICPIHLHHAYTYSTVVRTYVQNCFSSVLCRSYETLLTSSTYTRLKTECRSSKKKRSFEFLKFRSAAAAAALLLLFTPHRELFYRYRRTTTQQRAVKFESLTTKPWETEIYQKMKSPTLRRPSPCSISTEMVGSILIVDPFWHVSQ
jgi:hypothetical protein